MGASLMFLLHPPTPQAEEERKRKEREEKNIQITRKERCQLCCSNGIYKMVTLLRESMHLEHALVGRSHKDPTLPTSIGEIRQNIVAWKARVAIQVQMGFFLSKWWWWTWWWTASFLLLVCGWCVADQNDHSFCCVLFMQTKSFVCSFGSCCWRTSLSAAPSCGTTCVNRLATNIIWSPIYGWSVTPPRTTTLRLPVPVASCCKWSIGWLGQLVGFWSKHED